MVFKHNNQIKQINESQEKEDNSKEHLQRWYEYLTVQIQTGDQRTHLSF
jgi:hypothetical protein